MKPIVENPNYPRLDSIPEYRAEADKLARFHAELTKCESRIIELHAAWCDEQARASAQTDAERIAEAERLLAGKQVQDLAEQIKQNTSLAESLKRAIAAQKIVVRDARANLSRAAAKHFSAEHKRRTKRVVDALLELHAANEEEQSLRDSIELLGYDAQLPFMAFVPPNLDTMNPHEKSGGFIRAWYREANEYAMTEAQRQANAEQEASASRRRKLAALT
ncbi:hypothetical protein AB4Y43_18760 [Paraburkholderia sp. BR10872]|uniref:hypothetical protein n=1 Tax=Paraburkholderia sp. BR10872 TaxID=3236989 RepID=UPI0034D2122D